MCFHLAFQIFMKFIHLSLLNDFCLSDFNLFSFLFKDETTDGHQNL